MSVTTEPSPHAVSTVADGEHFRGEVREFIRRSLPDSWHGVGSLAGPEHREFLAGWRRSLHSNGLLAVTWPVEYGGRGLSVREQVVLAEEFALAGVPVGSENDNAGIQMIGTTLLALGTPEQRAHYLPKILTGEHVWCQGFSEPGAGSDLAGVSTRARLDGAEWVIDGQKTWTSYGHLATHVFVLCRTQPAESRHRGLSLLLVPIDQPGVQVRPMATLTGETEFNDVFFDEARCPADAIVGSDGQGWSAAMLLLGFERGEAAATLPIKFGRDVERLARLVLDRGLDEDSSIRQRLAKAAEGVTQMESMGRQALERWLAGDAIGAESSIHKLFWSEWLQETTALALDVLEEDSLAPTGLALQGMAFPAAEAGTPNSTAAWVDYYLRARAATIYAGSSEIQRTVIGERLLGLPRGPR